MTAKKKRETFISEEQEVCLTPIAIATETTETISEEVIPIPHVDPPKELEPWLDVFSTWTHKERVYAIEQVCIFVGLLRASENHNKPGK